MSGPIAVTRLMRQPPGKRDDIMVAIGEEITDSLLGHGDDEEDGGGSPVTELVSTDATTTTAPDDQPLQALQDWGTPFKFDPPDSLSTENLVPAQKDPAPPPPALISIPQPTGRLEDFGVEIPVSFLLQPENRIVPFLPAAMGWRHEILGWADESDRPLKLRLQAGAGGTGKTRLAIDVCETLADAGWFAGFLPSSFEKDDVERDLPTLLAGDRDCVFVVDYAETRADVVVTLARQLLIEVERRIRDEEPARKFRIVMLAREGGDWFNQLAERATRTDDDKLKALLTAGATKSGPHRVSVRPIALAERRRVFADALTAFSKKTGRSADGIEAPDLDAGRFDRVLMIQMAALAKLSGDDTGADQDLLDNTLGHERRYWRKLLDLTDDADDAPLKTFEQSLALFTMLGGRDSDAAAKDVIARVPRLRNLGPEAELSMFDCLRRFYPNRKDGDEAHVAGIKGLEPDLLGERLVANCLVNLGDDLLDAALDRKRGATADDARSAFTVLARLAIQRDKDQGLLRAALDRYFADWTKEILAVAKETGGPIGDLMVAATRGADRKTQNLIVRQAKGDVPEKTTNLNSFGIEIAKRSAEALGAGNKHKKPSRGDLEKLYSALTVLEGLHDSKLERREAAEVSAQALAVAKQLAKTGKPEVLLRLASSRVNYASSLQAIGRFSEALEQAIEAEKLGQSLQSSMSNRSDWRGIIVHSLGAHYAALSSVGRYESALDKIKEAIQCHRQFAKLATIEERARETDLYDSLSEAFINVGDYEAALDAAKRAEMIGGDLAEKKPEAFLAKWARELRMRSLVFSYLGEFKGALDDAEMAAKVVSQLAEQQPDLHAADLADALSHLSLHRRDNRLFGKALEAARREEFINRDLAIRQPEAFRFGWTISLANLGEALINIEDFAEAIEVTEKAIDLLPTLAPRPGDDNQRVAPGFCRRVLAEARLGAGESEVALAVAKEGCVNLRDAFADRPDHVAEHYVQGLATLAKCHRALGDDPTAISVLAEGIAGVTPLFLKRPRALQREMLRLIEPLDAIQPSAGHVSGDVRAELEKLPELPRGAAGL